MRSSLLLRLFFTGCLLSNFPVLLYGKSAIPLISLSFQQADISQVLLALAYYQQRNIVVSPTLHQSVTLQLTNVTWQQAFTTLLKMQKLDVTQQGTTLFISAKTSADSTDESMTGLKQTVIHLQYAKAEQVAQALRKTALLSANNPITVIHRTNSLLLLTHAHQLPAIHSWLNEFDKPLAQVQLSAHIVTINSDSLRELGVHWGLTNNALSQAPDLEQLTIDLAVPHATSQLGFRLAKLNHRLLNLELSALEQENHAEIIASPHLFTAHQQSASIKQGTEIPYEVSSGSTGATAIEFKEAVLGMEVTPTILGNNKITLKLHITQNVPGEALQHGKHQAVSINKQEITTQVTVNNGETIVLGGIFQQQQQNKQNRVPWLHQLPAIGGLFRYQQQQKQRRELVIFITPQLIAS